jgi:hypothetical protein
LQPLLQRSSIPEAGWSTIAGGLVGESVGDEEGEEEVLLKGREGMMTVAVGFRDSTTKLG